MLAEDKPPTQLSSVPAGAATNCRDSQLVPGSRFDNRRVQDVGLVDRSFRRHELLQRDVLPAAVTGHFVVMSWRVRR